MNKQFIEDAKITSNCKKKAVSKINTCYHPECNKKSINSHILQKNGFLSLIAKDKHIWMQDIDSFSKPQFIFKKIGIKKAYSFNCFCEYHDTHLFKKIETSQIDFDDYNSCVLLTLRTFYNELWRKEVNILYYKCLIENYPNLLHNPYFLKYQENEKLGINDLKYTEKVIWNDLKTDMQSFVFKYRKIDKIDICLTSFFNYETKEEMKEYILNNGHDMPRVTDIFINILPFKDYSILLMGYHKEDEKKVKSYFNTFFKVSQRKLQILLTNIIIFRVETWAISDYFFKKQIKEVENIFADATDFSLNNMNERRCFVKLNIFNPKFKERFVEWRDDYINRKKNIG